MTHVAPPTTDVRRVIIFCKRRRLPQLTAGRIGRRSAAPRRVGLLLPGLDLVKVEGGGAANAPQPAESLHGRTRPPAANDEAAAPNCLDVIFLPVLTQNLAATSSLTPTATPSPPLHLLFRGGEGPGGGGATTGCRPGASKYCQDGSQRRCPPLQINL